MRWGVNVHEFKNILVPVDGSEISSRAVDKAVALAKISGGVIDFIYVANITSLTGGVQITNNMSLPSEILENIKAAGNKALDDELAKVPHYVKTRRFCEVGVPSKVILEFATNNKSDIIVIGSRGLSAVNAMILGSVSQAVLENAHCPVMIVK